MARNALSMESSPEQPAAPAAPAETTGQPAPAPAAVTAYCVRCKAKREVKDPRKVTMKNGRAATKGTCPVDGGVLYRMGG